MAWSPLPTRDGGPGPGPAPIAGALDTVMASLGAPSVQALVTIHESWDDVVGPEVSPHARPSAITDGCLQIVVDSPGWASHLRWSEAEIVRRIGALVGPNEVTATTVRLARR